VSRRAALLIAGQVEAGGQPDVSVRRTVGHIGEVLLASDPRWCVSRPDTSRTDGSVRADLERELDELRRCRELVLVVAVGRIASTGAGPALVTARGFVESPDQATLPLRAIRECLSSCEAPRAIVVLGGWDGLEAERTLAVAWFDALATGRPGDLIAVGAAGSAVPTVEALLTSLAGRAIDLRTGTVTMRSLGEHVARMVPGAALQRSQEPETVISPAALAGSWDPRLTRLPPLATGTEHGSPALADDLTGVVLPGRFRVDALVARGGFGAVYRARQLSVERDVAIKVLHAAVDPGSPSGRLFVHEIQSVGRIDHPNVVRIHQADVTPDGRLFFAMELLTGRDLEQIVQEQGTLDAARAVGLTSQLVAALGAAHEVGLVHADVKPANAVVVPARDGERVVLVDFGLSRLRPLDEPAKSLGGTPAYMAPEQLSNGRVDARSDLFSAALLLVTLLTGWRRRSMEMLCPPLDDIVDPRLREILRRALAVEPAERFQTAAELADALAGREHRAAVATPTRRPFGRFAFTELDSDRFHGREQDIAALLEHVLYRRAVLLAGPGGIGKTSILRAGLIPRLGALGLRVAFGTGSSSTTELMRAIDARAQRSDGELVVVLDSAEDAPAVQTLVGAVAAARDVSVVVCAQDEVVAGLRVRLPDLPVLRAGPLDPEGARAAIVGPLAERRLAIEPILLTRLIADLQACCPDATGVCPAHLQAVCAALYEALPASDATLTLASYERVGAAAAIIGEPPGPSAPRARPRVRQTWIAAAALIAVAIVIGGTVWLSRRQGGAHPAARSPRPTVVVGGSGTVLWGFLEPVRAFLEQSSGVSLPLSVERDYGSGGAMKRLQSGTIELAALSSRFEREAPVELRTAGKLLVEVAIGFDETMLFVHRDNPLQRLDIAVFREKLCCARGHDAGPSTWRSLGIESEPLAGKPVRWILFGRNGPPRPGDTTSSTLAQADTWFCDASQLCPASERVDVEAHEVLQKMATARDVLALSSRSFATRGVHPVVVIDRARATRLDGRKVLWLYFAADRDDPIPDKLCRLMKAVLDPRVKRMLDEHSKAEALADAPGRRQRAALGLDDGSCVRRRVREIGGQDSGVARSPIARDIEVRERWIPEPR
jgi:hypothetical protein